VTRTRFKRGEASVARAKSALSWLGESDPLFGKGQSAPANRGCALGQLRDKPVLAVTGLVAEARVAAGPGIVVVSSCGCRANLEEALHRAVADGVQAIISFGIAGGLAPRLAAGSALVARAIVTETGERFHSDPIWSRRLSAAVGGAPIVDIAGVDNPVIDQLQKHALHVDTGAVAVDMESHVAARIADANNLPFAAFRVVADPAERSLPHAALASMRPDGKVAYGPLLRSLLRRPQQLPLLTRTALDAGAAFSTLFSSRKMIAGRLGFGDLGELLLDMPREDVVGRSLSV
jgi:adenosylhomocysteine nucleosidase